MVIFPEYSGSLVYLGSSSIIIKATNWSRPVAVRMQLWGHKVTAADKQFVLLINSKIS